MRGKVAPSLTPSIGHHLYSQSADWLNFNTRDRGRFFKPERFATKLTLQKKETLQLSNPTKFSSIHQETTKLHEFKVERFADKFVTVTIGKDPVRRHKRLDFPPDNGSFAYTGNACHWPSYHWRMAVQRSADLLLFAVKFSQTVALFFGLFGHNTKNPCTERSRLE